MRTEFFNEINGKSNYTSFNIENIFKDYIAMMTKITSYIVMDAKLVQKFFVEDADYSIDEQSFIVKVGKYIGKYANAGYLDKDKAHIWKPISLAKFKDEMWLESFDIGTLKSESDPELVFRYKMLHFADVLIEMESWERSKRPSCKISRDKLIFIFYVLRGDSVSQLAERFDLKGERIKSIQKTYADYFVKWNEEMYNSNNMKRRVLV